jgi:SAM-dependent methyltransferase
MSDRINDYERLGGWRSVLKVVPIMNFARSALGRARVMQTVASEYIKAEPGESVVDFGCGVASILPYLDDVQYVGVDVDENYIERARQVHGERGTFMSADLLTVSPDVFPEADIVLVRGFLHHLDDGHAEAILSLAAQVLNPGGRLVTIDPVKIEGQNPIARLLISLDRGPHIRFENGYRALIERVFSPQRLESRTDLLRLPYAHCVSVSRPAAR